MVRRGAATTQNRRGRVAVGAGTKAVRRPVRICNVGMVENIEEFKPELGGEPFVEFPALGHGQIHVPNPGVAEVIARRRAEGPRGRRNQNGFALEIAAVSVERSDRRRVDGAGGREAGIGGGRALGSRQQDRTSRG